MNFLERPFANRRAAGEDLAEAVSARKYTDPVVLALPRGGVPVAFEVAKALHAPLDLVMVRKLGAPGHEEYAIGAVVDGEQPQTILDRTAMHLTGASEDYVEGEKVKAHAEIERRRSKYGADTPVRLTGKTAIIVDDGIATGSTAKAAILAIRRANPAWIVLAVPVAPQDSLEQISPLCDEIICLSMPRPFYAVGAHYEDFGQTSDVEVMACLSKARELLAETGR